MINVSRSFGQFNRFNSTGASEFVTRSVAQGASKSEELVAIIEDPGDVRLPPLGREALARAWCANRAALLRRAKPGTRPGWADRLLARRPTNIVLVAMANRTARVAWALLRHERIYQPVSA